MNTSRKPTSATRKTKARTSKPSAAPDTAAEAVASEETTAQPVEVAEGRVPSLRKRELIDKIVKRSGVKKKAAKPVVEALLAELGETLAAGRELVLPPLGRFKINREKSLANGRVMILKVRQKDAQAAPAPETAVAE